LAKIEYRSNGFQFDQVSGGDVAIFRARKNTLNQPNEWVDPKEHLLESDWKSQKQKRSGSPLQISSWKKD
jgi:hypothetical protein